MKMMVVTVMIRNVVMALVMEMKHMIHVQTIVAHQAILVLIVNLISLTTVQSVVTQHGMSSV